MKSNDEYYRRRREKKEWEEIRARGFKKVTPENLTPVQNEKTMEKFNEENHERTPN